MPAEPPSPLPQDFGEASLHGAPCAGSCDNRDPIGRQGTGATLLSAHLDRIPTTRIPADAVAPSRQHRLALAVVGEDDTELHWCIVVTSKTGDVVNLECRVDGTGADDADQPPDPGGALASFEPLI